MNSYISDDKTKNDFYFESMMSKSFDLHNLHSWSIYQFWLKLMFCFNVTNHIFHSSGFRFYVQRNLSYKFANSISLLFLQFGLNFSTGIWSVGLGDKLLLSVALLNQIQFAPIFVHVISFRDERNNNSCAVAFRSLDSWVCVLWLTLIILWDCY